MTTPTPPVEPVAPVPPATPAPVRSQAASIRVYLLGLVAAVVGAVIPIVQASLGNVQWSAAWLSALGVAVLVPALTAALHYLSARP